MLIATRGPVDSCRLEKILLGSVQVIQFDSKGSSLGHAEGNARISLAASSF
jgi:hypothetical protein